MYAPFATCYTGAHIRTLCVEALVTACVAYVEHNPAPVEGASTTASQADIQLSDKQLLGQRV